MLPPLATYLPPSRFLTWNALHAFGCPVLVLVLVLQVGDMKGKIYTHCGTNPGMQKLSLRSGGQTVSKVQ